MAICSPKVPMGSLFRACESILWDRFMPVHYGDLTRLAIGELGVEVTKKEFVRCKEDVREKMLEARRYGTFYVPSPHFFGAIRDWFKTDDVPLLNVEPYLIKIPSDATWSIEASTEILMRRRYMLDKIPSADPLRRERGASSGIHIEKHISYYFRDHWAEQWFPPDNENKYYLPCPHDFKLFIDGVMYQVDVMGPHANGKFSVGDKKVVDFHLIGEVAGPSYYFQGFLQGGDVPSGYFSPTVVKPPSRLIVLLNCAKHGIDHDVLRRYANKFRKKTG
jgi:hypothetical protein